MRIDPGLFARHDRPGPRYTSYPTAVEFDTTVGPDRYRRALTDAAERPDQPLSLYVHLPFCAARCSFCACHVVVTRRPEVSAAYIDHLVAESELVATALGERRRVVQYHWGGGTPTHHPPDALARLHQELTSRFEMAADAEIAVEVDPRVTNSSHLEMLAAAGFNRLSLGVQDLDPRVQELIGRHQTRDQTETLYLQARRLGFASINLDLVYGLPGQDEHTLAETLATVVDLRPDRLAVYSFAYVPMVRSHQRRLDPELLPQPMGKLGLLCQVVETLTAAGYRQVGMDHFALPGDELVLAADTGTLTRNFMGYTTRRGTEVVALGTSAISDISGVYAQGHRRLHSYYSMVAAGLLPVERGCRLTDDDRFRRRVITDIMCNGRVDLDGDFEAERVALLGLAEEGLVTVTGTVVAATPLGRFFLRRIAAVFDAHTPAAGTVFSHTV